MNNQTEDEEGIDDTLRIEYQNSKLLSRDLVVLNDVIGGLVDVHEDDIRKKTSKRQPLK